MPHPDDPVFTRSGHEGPVVVEGDRLEEAARALEGL